MVIYPLHTTSSFDTESHQCGGWSCTAVLKKTMADLDTMIENEMRLCLEYTLPSHQMS